MSNENPKNMRIVHMRDDSGNQEEGRPSNIEKFTPEYLDGIIDSLRIEELAPESAAGTTLSKDLKVALIAHVLIRLGSAEDDDEREKLIRLSNALNASLAYEELQKEKLERLYVEYEELKQSKKEGMDDRAYRKALAEIIDMLFTLESNPEKKKLLYDEFKLLNSTLGQMD